MSARTLVTFDLDSTLADTRHRHHMIDPEGRTDWRAYSMACTNDAPIEGVLALAHTLQDHGVAVWVVSGRDAAAMSLTKSWFRWIGFKPDGIILDNHEVLDESHTEYKVRAIGLAEQYAQALHVLHVDDWPPVGAALEAAGRRCLIVTPPKILDGFTPSGHLTFV